METTGRFDLPLIMPNQAQKHVTHNEALTLVDGLCHLVISSFGENAPPPTALIDDAFVIGTAPTGDWFGESGNIAFNTDVGWRFIVPRQGIIALNAATSKLVIFDQNVWKPLDSALNVSSPTTLGINTSSDATNRLALRSNAALLTAIHAGDGGNGDMQLKINKEQVGDTASLLYQTGFSGRAEMGLAGDDDFRIKVSPDGATWTDALVINKITGATTLANNSVANAVLADMPTASFKARVAAGTGDPQDITGTQATTLLDTFTTTLKGLAPASGGGTANFLRADGAWASPPAGGSSAWGAITGTLSSQTDLQTALNGKAASSHTHVHADVTGLVAALAAKEPSITAGTAAQYIKGDKTLGTHDKASVGLGNVDNTADAAKPVSTATATALAGKSDTSHTHTDVVAAGASGFMSGADKTKLNGIAAGATVNATDAALRDRASHTGTQLAATISDFAESVDDRVAALLVPGTNVTLSYDDAANTLTINATGGGAGGVEAGPARFYAFNDCHSTTNTADWNFTLSGTGAAHTVVDYPDQNSIGAAQSALGTVATNRTSITSPVFTVFQLGQGNAKWANRLQLLTLSDATNTWTLRSGFIDSLSTESTDGVFFRYTNGVNAGKFQAVTRSVGVETAVDTGITAAINTTYKMEVEVNAAGTSALFKINGTLVATITTNIPTGNGREVGYGLAAIRSVGVAAVNSYIVDYLLADLSFATLR